MNRIYALLLRHFYLYRGSRIRFIELFYWSLTQVVMWGSVSRFLVPDTDILQKSFGLLMIANILCAFLLRIPVGVSGVVLDEQNSRHLGQLFVSPIHFMEFAISLMIIGFFHTTIGVILASVLAYILYDVSIFTVGPHLFTCTVLLVTMGWAVGLIFSALVIRFSAVVEYFLWQFLYLIMVLTPVYYPLSVQPTWLQHITVWMPSTHAFEYLRAHIFQTGLESHHLMKGLYLDILYMLLGVSIYAWSFRQARKKGLLLTVMN